MNMLQFPFLVLFDGDLCLESADAVRSAILTADAFGVVREKDESCVFVDQTRFNLSVRNRMENQAKVHKRLARLDSVKKSAPVPERANQRPLHTRQGDLLF